MLTSSWPCVRRAAALLCVVAFHAAPLAAEQLWIAPTYQTDFGGVGVASNGFWPVTVVGAARFAWGVPADLQTFQSARIVIIPHSPAGAAALNIFVCRAENGVPVGSACTGPVAHAFTGVANQLLEVDVSAAIAAQVGIPGQTHVAVLAYTTPTTTTDHIVGLRFVYTPVLPAGVATLGANTFTDSQVAPAFVGDGSALTNVNAAQVGGFSPSAFAPAAHGHDVTQVANAASVMANTFAGTQTINGGNLDIDRAASATAGLITKDGVRFLHNAGNAIAGNTFLGLESGNVTTIDTFLNNQNTGIGWRSLTGLTTGMRNTAVGSETLFRDTTGQLNTGLGSMALKENTEGSGNTAVGDGALDTNTTGNYNTAVGLSALTSNTTAIGSTAVGYFALLRNTGGGNVGVGYEALVEQGSGTSNTAIGTGALRSLTAGNTNTAVGWNAGSALTTGSDNVYLASTGAATDSRTIRLGRSPTHTRAFIAGVRGVTTGVADAVPVVIDSAGQLGTVSSSRRVKEDIADMADASSALLQLRPVTFRYARPFEGGVKPVQFGLIAEEVAEVFPELAVMNANGEAETVKYQDMAVLLLNELQKLHREVQEQRERSERLERELRDVRYRSIGR